MEPLPSSPFAFPLRGLMPHRHRTHCHNIVTGSLLFHAHVLTDDDRRRPTPPKSHQHQSAELRHCPYRRRHTYPATNDPSLDGMDGDDYAHTIVVLGMVTGGHCVLGTTSHRYDDILTIKAHANYCSYMLKVRSASVSSSLIFILSCFYFF